MELFWNCIGIVLELYWNCIGIVVFSCVNCIGIGIGPKCQYCSTVISIALILFKGLSMACGVSINHSCVPAEAGGRGGLQTGVAEVPRAM